MLNQLHCECIKSSTIGSKYLASLRTDFVSFSIDVKKQRNPIRDLIAIFF